MNRFSARAALGAALLLLLAGCDQGTESAPAPPPVPAAPPDAGIPLGRLPRIVVPEHYRLDLTINPRMHRFSGRAEIDVNVTHPQTTVFLHGENLNVKRASATLAGGGSVPAAYKQVHRTGIAQLTFERELPAGRAKLVLVYDAPFGTALYGLYKVHDRGADYAFTQFEPISARMMFPSFDEPSFKTTFDVTVIAPSADKVIANTPVSKATTERGMTRTVFERTKSLPTYLIALAVGPLDIVDMGTLPPNKYRKHALPVRGITAKGKGNRIRYALGFTPKLVLALEKYFGVGYPFQKLDSLAVPDFAAGAMENAGAITYRERLLLMDAKAPLDQKRASIQVQAHELAHQWFGNLVTLEWWDDIWLNESFANWAENKAITAVAPQFDFGREIAREGMQIMEVDELPSAKRIRQPVGGTEDIINAFDRISYNKGAAVIAMFESYLGEPAFRQGVQAYLKKFAFGTATAKDFIGTVAHETSHPEIVEAFSEFIDQSGIPLLHVALVCKVAPVANVVQSTFVPVGRTPAEHYWKVPACLEPLGGERICRLMDSTSASVPLGNACPQAVMPNAEGKGYYRFALDEAGWRALVAASPRMKPADQLALFHNVAAAMRAGKASATDFFRALSILAPVARWDLLGEIDSSAPLSLADTLRGLRMNLVSAADMPAYRKLMARLFAPRLDALGLRARAGERPADALARAALAKIMVEEARDAKTVKALARDARIYVASGGKNANGLPPELVPVALRAGLLDEGPAFRNDVFALFRKSDDENLRRAILAAASISEDKEFLRRFLALALQPDMRIGELTYLYQFWPRESVSRDVLWEWLKQNYGAILKRVSKRGMNRAPDTLATACTEEARQDLESFFRPHVAELQGAVRPLALSSEKISDCVALKKEKGAEISAALRAAAK
ncbi:MAG: M1 family metallopeptidase [Alphaproteobacteria bacterium]